MIISMRNSINDRVYTVIQCHRHKTQSNTNFTLTNFRQISRRIANKQFPIGIVNKPPVQNNHRSNLHFTQQRWNNESAFLDTTYRAGSTISVWKTVFIRDTHGRHKEPFFCTVTTESAEYFNRINSAICHVFNGSSTGQAELCTLTICMTNICNRTLRKASVRMASFHSCNKTKTTTCLPIVCVREEAPPLLLWLVCELPLIMEPKPYSLSIYHLSSTLCSLSMFYHGNIARLLIGSGSAIGGRVYQSNSIKCVNHIVAFILSSLSIFTF